jgi:hypothetical protein
MPLPPLLSQHIIRTEIKINKSNFKTYCKACIEELGEEEGGKTWFPNKRDRIIQHFKKCSNFVSKTTAEERAEIFKLLENNKELALSSSVSTSTLSNKRPCNY